MAVNYSNSSLVNYTKISPNKNTTRVHSVYNPTGKITKITIHHMAGNLSVEACGNEFAPTSRQGSSNYGIGSDGRVGLYVDEKHRAWTSGSADNDYKAVTIEVANDGGASTNWHVSDKAYAKLIDLCVDICKRNGISKLNYTGDATGNLTRHNMFQATICPGQYLQSKFDDIAKQVNKRLNPTCNGEISGYNIVRQSNYLVVYDKGSNTGTNVWGTEVAIDSNGIATCAPVYGKGSMVIPSGGYVISGHGVASDWIKNNIKKGSKIIINNDVIKVGAVVSTPVCNGKINGYNKVRQTNYLVIYDKGKNTGTNQWGTEVAVNSNGVATCTPVYGKGNMAIPSGGFVISGHGIASNWIKKNIKKGSKIVVNNNVIKVGAVVSTNPSPTPTSTTLKVGDKVKLKAGAYMYGTKSTFAPFIYNSVLYVREINGSRIVISTQKTGAVTGAVEKNSLVKI